MLAHPSAASHPRRVMLIESAFADSDSGDDIPFKNPSPQDDAEDDDEEEEYAVEKVLRHEWKRNKLFFEVKWAGYDETTLEPEDNLEGCPDELQTYYKAIGGRPSKPGASKPGRPPASSLNDRKRGASDSKEKDSTPPAKRAKTGRGAGGSKQFVPPSGSWEDHLIGIETVALDPKTGAMEGYVEWTNGHKSKHATSRLAEKAPQHLIRFYEAHV